MKCVSPFYFQLKNITYSGAPKRGGPWRELPGFDYLWLKRKEADKQIQIQGEAPKRSLSWLLLWGPETIAKLTFIWRGTLVNDFLNQFLPTTLWCFQVFHELITKWRRFQVSPLKHLESCFVAASKSAQTIETFHLQRNHAIMGLHSSTLHVLADDSSIFEYIDMSQVYDMSVVRFWTQQDFPGLLGDSWFLEITDLEVSIDGGTPKLSILMGFSFWTIYIGGSPIYGNPHLSIPSCQSSSCTEKRTAGEEGPGHRICGYS